MRTEVTALVVVAVLLVIAGFVVLPWLLWLAAVLLACCFGVYARYKPFRASLRSKDSL